MLAFLWVGSSPPHIRSEATVLMPGCGRREETRQKFKGLLSFRVFHHRGSPCTTSVYITNEEVCHIILLSYTQIVVCGHVNSASDSKEKLGL